MTPSAVQRVGLLAASTLTTLNIWTGSPLLGLWVGSRLLTADVSPMLAFASVGITIGAVSLLLVKVLAILSARYDELVGRVPHHQRQVPWLRSLRAERPAWEQERDKDAARPSGVETIAIASVVLVVVLFEIWFFFFSPSPIDQRSGRD